jgi:histidine phosphotransferase ChpT
VWLIPRIFIAEFLQSSNPWNQKNVFKGKEKMRDGADITISQILSSRLCHDLIAPISAVKTGLELLSEIPPGETDTQVLDLIMHSAESLSRRLTFFRFAFGYSSVNHIKALNDVHVIIDEYLDPKKHQLSWQVDSGFIPLSEELKVWAKLTANLVSCCVDATPYGGKIRVQFDHSGNLLLALESQTSTLQAEIKATLEVGRPSHEVTAHTVQAYLCYWWLQDLEKRLIIEEHPNQLLLYTAPL